MKYTVPQNTAICYGGGNLLLSAAAGSGKTASLTARIVRLILEGEAKMNEMLIVTYTRAAAAEMRSRIRKKLSDAAHENRSSHPEIARRAADALAALPSASISTIHSFLYREMRPYFSILGMPPDTRIMDTGSAQKLKTDIMRDVVDDFFSKTGEEGRSFQKLCDVIGQARETMAVDREMLWLADKLVSFGMHEEGVEKYVREYELFCSHGKKFFETEMGRFVIREVSAFAMHYVSILSDTMREFEDYPAVLEKYGGTLSYIIDRLTLLSDTASEPSPDYGAIRDIITSYSPPKLKRLDANDVCHASDKFKFWRDRLKEDLCRLKENYFASNEDEIKYTARMTAEILKSAGEVLSEYFTRLREAKRSRGVIDYSDLETMALELFVKSSDPAPAREVQEKFRYVFIDEYQDTNSVQDAIFSALSKNSVRFMVGDIKQSIYRFRKADPRVFSSYRLAWSPLDGDELIEDGDVPTPTEKTVGEGGRSLFMSDNFRCDSAIIDFVNMISAHTLACGSIPYVKEDDLICKKNDGVTPRTPVDVVLIEKKRASSNDEDPDDDKTVSANPEAAYIAARIASMIGKYRTNGEGIITPSDIVILMRSPGSSAKDYEKELAACGIPCHTNRPKKLTEYPSVMLILCLLNLANNPMHDIYTAGALHSAVFGFTLSEISYLREISDDLPLYVAILKLHSGEIYSENEKLLEKCKKVVESVEEMKTVSRGMSADRFLEFLIRETNLYATLGIRTSGEERDAISRLMNMARSFEGGGAFGGISGFIDYVAETDEEESSAPDTGAVRIMSIHASKGLEFPVVFLAECGKRRNTDDESGTLLFDDAVGLGMMLPDEGGLARCDTVMRHAIAGGIRDASVAEEMRMLYVALTRAAEQLIVTGRTFDAEGTVSTAAFIAESADSYDAAHANYYLDWITEAAARHGSADFYTLSAVSSKNIYTGSIHAAIEGQTDDVPTNLPPEAAVFRARFDTPYPREHLSKIPSKLTVSRLYPEILDGDGESESAFIGAEEDTNSPERPRFMTGEAGSDAALIGSATHVFMQFANFDRLCTHGAAAELDTLVAGGFMSSAMAGLVNLRQIERFIGSSLIDKMRRSPMIKREFRFNALMNADRFTDDEELSAKLSRDNIKLTVQGVVDCVFRDPDTGELVLVDYKTDRVTSEEWRDPALAAEAFRRRHKNQLSYYREICSRMFGEEIGRAEVYSTVLGRCIEI